MQHICPLPKYSKCQLTFAGEIHIASCGKKRRVVADGVVPVGHCNGQHPAIPSFEGLRKGAQRRAGALLISCICRDWQLGGLRRGFCSAAGLVCSRVGCYFLELPTMAWQGIKLCEEQANKSKQM